MNTLSFRTVVGTILTVLIAHICIGQSSVEIRTVILESEESMAVELESEGEGVFQVERSTDLENWEFWKTLREEDLANENGPTLLHLPTQPNVERFFYRIEPSAATADQNDLNHARARWNSAGLETYRYTYRRTCFCDPETTRKVIISVVDSQLDSVVSEETGETLEIDSYMTIDQLFALIQSEIDRPSEYISVRYDSNTGYPTTAHFDLSIGIADEEYGFDANLHGTTIISDTYPVGIAEKHFAMSDASLEGSILKIAVEGSAGLSNPKFTLHMTPGNFFESNPVQADLYLRYGQSDSHSSVEPNENIYFDISPILDLYETQYQSDGAIMLHISALIEGMEKYTISLLYEP